MLINQKFQKIKRELSKFFKSLVLFKVNFNSNGGFKYFNGFKEGKIVKPLSIILPQMTGYIKCFDNRGKNMSFIIKDNDVLDKYNEILGKIKEPLSIKFHSVPIYHEKYIKVKVR